MPIMSEKRPKSSKFYISGWLQKFVMVWTSFLGPPRIVRSPRILGPPMNEIFLGPPRILLLSNLPLIFFLRSENTAIYIKIDALSHTPRLIKSEIWNAMSWELVFHLFGIYLTLTEMYVTFLWMSSDLNAYLVSLSFQRRKMVKEIRSKSHPVKKALYRMIVR